MKLFRRHILKTVKYNYILRLLVNRYQRIRLFIFRLPGIYRIDAVCLYLFKFIIRNLAGNQINHCRLNNGFFIFLKEFYALHSRIRTLVKLARKKLHAKHAPVRRNFNALPVKNIYRRFRKHTVYRPFKGLPGNIFHIVTDKYPHILNACDSQITADFFFQFSCLYRKRGFLFYIDTFYVSHGEFNHPPFLYCFMCCNTFIIQNPAYFATRKSMKYYPKETAARRGKSRKSPTEPMYSGKIPWGFCGTCFYAPSFFRTYLPLLLVKSVYHAVCNVPL